MQPQKPVISVVCLSVCLQDYLVFVKVVSRSSGRCQIESVISDIYCEPMGLKDFSVLFSSALIISLKKSVKLHSVLLNDDQDITTAVTVASSNAALLHMLQCAPRHPLQSCPAAHGHSGAHMRPRSTCCHVRRTGHRQRPHQRPQAPPATVLCTARAFSPRRQERRQHLPWRSLRNVLGNATLKRSSLYIC